MKPYKEIIVLDTSDNSPATLFIVADPDKSKAESIINNSYEKWLTTENKADLGESLKAYISNCLNEAGIDCEISGKKDYFNRAAHYFSKECSDNKNFSIINEFVENHSTELMYCYANKMSIVDFDFWTQYEKLANDTLTWPEYIAVDSKFHCDPCDYDENDKETVDDIKSILAEYRKEDIMKNKKPEERKKPLDEQIAEAVKQGEEERAAKAKSKNKAKEKTNEPMR